MRLSTSILIVVSALCAVNANPISHKVHPTGPVVEAQNSPYWRRVAEADGPSWKRVADGPSWKREANDDDGPSGKREADGPYWKREADGPSWK